MLLLILKSNWTELELPSRYRLGKRRMYKQKMYLYLHPILLDLDYHQVIEGKWRMYKQSLLILTSNLSRLEILSFIESKRRCTNKDLLILAYNVTGLGLSSGEILTFNFLVYVWISLGREGIDVLNSWGTLSLLSSGAAVTWAHHAILAGFRKQAVVEGKWRIYKQRLLIFKSSLTEPG